jgi:hypothetical protein
MKDAPLQVRFEKPTKKKLKAHSAKTGIDQAEIIRFAVAECFSKYKTLNELSAAYFEARKLKAAGGVA